MNIREQIFNIAKAHGAEIAGIANVELLRSSPSHRIYPYLNDYSGVGTVTDGDTLTKEELFNWPPEATSVLVVGLPHPENRPELDWWDGKGGTPGNRQLMGIIKRTSEDIEKTLHIKTHNLHYYVEKGGTFLKDAAVLAGLGSIGKSNLFISPEYGPRIRLRALFLNAELEPTGPVDFDPCTGCDVYCRKVCPEGAMDLIAPSLSQIHDTSTMNSLSRFGEIDTNSLHSTGLPARDGSYDREQCNTRMEKDIEESAANSDSGQAPVKYCRKCEIACPAGNDR